MRVAAVLLYIAATVCSQQTPRECSDMTRNDALLMDEQPCNVTVVEGHVNALCSIAITWPLTPQLLGWHTDYSNILRIELHLVSNMPVAHITPDHEPVCLSLHKIHVEKNKGIHYR
ncbi:hypothetical protein MTO96_015026 [Rhipicephalus appendiculatus]